ncbi:DUF4244 domain-containing protein [Kitasatospora sp. NPDC015120]|uniref:DUF4244 domain-containing protein n=1 Tax=Kitasatospora sp. NPDC015120 TaxID=3364023 RepID=UPI0036F487F1
MNLAIRNAAVAAPGAPQWIRTAIRTALRTTIRRRSRSRGGRDAGMTTAEYAVGTLGACALGAALYKVATSAAVLEALAGALDRALHAT